MALSGPAAGFIGASVTLVLVIIFMILMVILVRQCLAFLAKRNHLRQQLEQQQQRQNQQRQRRGSITEPVPATFDWHHSIRIAGTPPPSYGEAKKLPSFDDAIEAGEEKQEHKVAISKESEDMEDAKKAEELEESFMVVNGMQSTTSAATGQSVTMMMNGSGSRSRDHALVTSGAGENVTVQIDIENHSGEESRTFSTGYTQYGST